MIGEAVLAKVQHTRKKQLSVVMMCIGVVSFTLLGQMNKKAKANDSTSYETAIGLGTLLFLQRVCMFVAKRTRLNFQNKIQIQIVGKIFESSSTES